VPLESGIGSHGAFITPSRFGLRARRRGKREGGRHDALGLGCIGENVRRYRALGLRRRHSLQATGLEVSGQGGLFLSPYLQPCGGRLVHRGMATTLNDLEVKSVRC
jgi:hypothetical protein